MWQLPEDITPDDILDYLRKSRADDPLLTVEEVLAKHEQMLDDWVAKNLPGKGKVPEENRYREVVSGETLDSRPQVQALLRRIESPKVKAVLIVEPQRLSRGDLEDIGRLVKLFRYTNTLVITLQYTYDLRDERDRDLFERELKRGNEFLEYQKRIMNNGRLLAVQNGNFIGKNPPYGFKKLKIKEGRRTCHTLEPHPEEAPVVQLIFDLYLQGMGTLAIADKMYEMKIPTPQGGKFWHRSTIRTILMNDHYIGKVHWEKYKAIKTIEEGELVVKRPMSEEFLVFPGKHEPIIAQEVFDAVQEKMGSLPRVKSKIELINPFAGVFRCTCGRPMNYKRYAHAAPRFFCMNQRHCGNASCLATEVFEPVKKILQETIEDFQIRIEAGTDDSLEVHRQLVERLEKRLANLEALEVAQWEKYTLEGMPKHIFDQLNKKVLEEKEEVQEALCVAKDAVPDPVDYQAKEATFREVLDMLNDPDAPARELNDLVKECIEQITYSRPNTQGSKPRYKTGAPVQLDIKLKV